MIDMKGVTNLELSKHLIKRLNSHEWRMNNRFEYQMIECLYTLYYYTQKLQTYDLKHLNTHEKEFRIVWSPSQPQSPSKAMREFSSGDSSPCDDEQYQAKVEFIGSKLSIRDICNSVLNSNCYEIRILEPTKTGKYEKIPQEWINQRDIILFNYDPSLESCSDKHSLKKYMKEKFKDYHFIGFEEFQKVYLVGEQAYIIKINEDKSAQFFYFNMNKNQVKHKKYLGDNFQVGILKKIKEQTIKYRVIMRFLPNYIGKERIENMLYEKRIERTFRVEELFEYEGCKYGMIYCENTNQCEQIVDILNRYFFERKMSQPEIVAINEDGKRLSSLRNNQEFTDFFQGYQDSEKQLKTVLQIEIDKEIQEKQERIERQERQEKQERLERQERAERERIERHERQERQERTDRQDRQYSSSINQKNAEKNNQETGNSTVEINSSKQHDKHERSVERNTNQQNYYHHNNRCKEDNNVDESGVRGKGRRSRSQSRKRRHSSSDSSKKYHDRKHRQNRYETKRKSGWENNSKTRK